MKIQQDLIAKGAKIKADGIMGPATKAAQAQFAPKPAAAQAPVKYPGATPATTGLPASVPGSIAAITNQVAAEPAPAANAPAASLGGLSFTDASKKANAAAAQPAPAAAPADTTTAGGAAMANKPAAAPLQNPTGRPANYDSEEGQAAFDPTWGGTKAAPDTRTVMQKVLPNFAGGQSAPVAANQNATWNNAQQRAVSNPPLAAPAVAESVGFQNDELSRIISLVHHR